MSIDGVDNLIVEKFAIPLLLGLISWFLKDYALGIRKQREEAIREEWKRRLVEIWGPLFYWSGAVLFGGTKVGIDRHGVAELEKLMTQCAHLLPLRHYRVMVRLIEHATGQKTKPLSVQELNGTRAYIYGQIEVLNFVLYRQHVWFDPSNGADVFASIRLLVRTTTEIGIHLAIWIAITALLFALYVASDAGLNWLLWIVCGGVSLAVLGEVRRRMRVRKQMMQRLAVR